MILSTEVENSINSFLKSGYGLRIDVGLSHNAPYLFEWIKTNKHIIVLGFEPNYESFLKVQSELIKLPPKLKSRAFIFNFAIDDVDLPQIKDFYITGERGSNLDPGNSSLLEPIGLFKDSILRIDKVHVVPLFHILNRLNFNFIEFLKIDTQGNDLSVLKSLRVFDSKLFLVQAERDCSDWYEGSHTGLELDHYMKSRGLDRLTSFRRFNEMDSIYLNKRIESINFVPFKFFDLFLANYNMIIKLILAQPIVILEFFHGWLKYKFLYKTRLYLMKIKHKIKMFVSFISVRP